MKNQAHKHTDPGPDDQPDDRLLDDEAIETVDSIPVAQHGLGPNSAGQSGDTQGLFDVAEADSESVRELLEEGQYYEADAIRGVEDAPDPDVAEVHTRQLLEDDVPREYDDEGTDSR